MTRYKLAAISLLILGALAGSAHPKTQTEPEEMNVDEANAVVNKVVSPDEIVLDQVVDADDYTVGPGDQLTVVFTGKVVNRHVLEITPEGVLLVPEFGPITVAHMSLASAKARILGALSSRYKNVETSVSLTRLRHVKVTVSGEVERPGIYVLSAGDRVSEAVRMAGGVLEGASIRNLTLIRDDTRHKVDLLKHSLTGARGANPYVLEGDVIVVPASEELINRVGIFGAVRAPGSFEYAADDRLSDLLMMSYGLTADADSFNLKIVRFEADNLTKRTIDVYLPRGEGWIDSVRNIELHPDDRVYLRSIPEYHETAQAAIRGEVIYPGTYPVVEDSTRVTDLIRMAGGLTEDASLSEAYMNRSGFESVQEGEIERQLKLSANELDDIEKEYLKSQTTDRAGRVSIDFRKLLIGDDESYNITLKNGDQIIIPKLSRTVRVIGKVVRPGLIEFSYGRSAEYYIELAGGFGWKANKGKVRIVKGTSGAIVKPSRKVAIEVGDAVVVPEKMPRNWWEMTKDVGTFLANIATVYIVIDQVVK